MISKDILLLIVLAPLIAAAIAGLGGARLPRVVAHSVTIGGVAIACGLSIYVLTQLLGSAATFNENLYTWLVSDGIQMNIGFMVDKLTALMMVVVTSVSLCVHVYTIGYMHDDPSYQRFFSYISLFTFAMLMLVMANNFLQLFFGWEAVGVVSYLLIGFWYTRPTAIFANMKAFLVNRIGDFGFVLGIAAIVFYTGSLDYQAVFAAAPSAFDGKTMQILGSMEWQAITVACICLFVGAMGKSAQVPLHVWLPDSMEGPTPISALIHAATMVTAGIFMVARMSPLFEMSEVALSTVLVIGTITAFSMGLLGLVANDIKRVVAYSTLSQLGYMTVALGVSAYGAAIFHLMTHAFFKALLFLAAGSVIIGMHHEQDMRKMGGLKKYMPITYWTCLIGSLALIGFPGTSGFFSKDAILEAIHESHNPIAGVVYWFMLAGVFITAFYSFRLVFMTFHGPERFAQNTQGHMAAHGQDAHHAVHKDPHHQDEHGHDHHGGTPHESPWVVWLPLVVLAIPSLIVGWLTIGPVLFDDYFNGAIQVAHEHNVIGHMKSEFHGPTAFVIHGMQGLPVYLALAGVVLAWFLYIKRPDLPAKIAASLSPLYTLFVNKYYVDDFNQKVFAGGSLGLGKLLWKVGDSTLIDGIAVNGSARAIGWLSGIVRHIQSGYLYQYAFTMIIGLAALLAWFLWL
ncbi:MAG TPA: NADH-quinone oxidoreductase subunit L [Steroidobacteraceae bacterium]|nr:NADH-quinone oxidoreductase subunit L [Steroidobacteraceae bacterium]